MAPLLYKASNVTGSSHVRAKLLHFANEAEAPPVATIVKERMTVLDNGSVLKEPMGSLIVNYDPPKSFPIRNIADGSVTEKVMTHEEFYTVMYSFFMAEDEADDAAQAAVLAEAQAAAQAMAAIQAAEAPVEAPVEAQPAPPPAA